jgi:hypothetical protein
MYFRLVLLWEQKLQNQSHQHDHFCMIIEDGYYDVIKRL